MGKSKLDKYLGEIRHMAGTGSTLKEIADAIGVSFASTYRYMQKKGIPTDKSTGVNQTSQDFYGGLALEEMQDKLKLKVEDKITVNGVKCEIKQVCKAFVSAVCPRTGRRETVYISDIYNRNLKGMKDEGEHEKHFI